MDMRQVRHLIAVLEHGNVLRAANAIHISQPALSKSIQNLEAELGVQLLERSPRGVSPTIYGTNLLKHARLLLNQGEQAVADIKGDQGRAPRPLAFGSCKLRHSFSPCRAGEATRLETGPVLRHC